MARRSTRSTTIRQVLDILEQQFVLVTLIQDVLDRGLTVAIGTEHGVQPLADCSIVVAPYQIEGERAGTVGILGPTRMHYEQTLAAVAVVEQTIGPGSERGTGGKVGSSAVADVDDFYELLGVSRKAHRGRDQAGLPALARELHPDANPGDADAEELFKQVNLAYETLRDPGTPAPVRHVRPGAPGLAGRARRAGDPFAGFGGGFGDLFDAFFGGSGAGWAADRREPGRSGPRKGEDAEAAVILDFAEAVFGVHHELTVRLPHTCATCGGSGPGPGPPRSPAASARGPARFAGFASRSSARWSRPPRAPAAVGPGRRSRRRARTAGATAGAARSGRSWSTSRPGWTKGRRSASPGAARAACGAVRRATCMCTSGSATTRRSPGTGSDLLAVRARGHDPGGARCDVPFETLDGNGGPDDPGRHPEWPGDPACGAGGCRTSRAGAEAT